MRNIFAIFLLAAALTGAAQPATAQIWSSIASACVPDSPTIQHDRYSSSPDNAVTLQAQKIDPVVLICAVPPTAAQAYGLSMTYVDPIAAATSVKARLVRVNRTNGARVVLATLDSNDFPTQAGVSRRTVFFNHVMDFGANFYHVRIEMDRATAGQNIRVIGVALELPPPT